MRELRHPHETALPATATQTATDIGSWYGATMRFQDGDYQQDVPGGSDSDGGLVTFSALCQYGVPGGAASSNACGGASGGGAFQNQKGRSERRTASADALPDIR